jgi:hypothetical protein
MGSNPSSNIADEIKIFPEQDLVTEEPLVISTDQWVCEFTY